MSAVLQDFNERQDAATRSALTHCRWIGTSFQEALKAGNVGPFIGEKRLTAFDILTENLVGEEEKAFAEAVSKIVNADYDSGCAAFLRFVALARHRVETQAFEAAGDEL